MDPWSASTLFVALLILIPLATVVIGLVQAGPKWDHLASTVLWTYVWNTVILVGTVSILSLLFALPQAWLVSAFQFPGRKFFEWALVMPLAIPTYVAAFVYFQHTEAAIPALVEIRKSFGVDAFIWSEKILRYGLLSILMAGVLSPYLYISARTSFSRQQRATIEAARTLGRGPFSVFFTVALPLARPAIVAGLSLILMEVVNDYGAVHFFGVPTLTEGIFRTWFGLGDRSSALRLAGLVMLAVLFVLLIERGQRGKARFSEFSRDQSPTSRVKLGAGGGIVAMTVCLIPLVIGLIYPLWQLIGWAVMTFDTVIRNTFREQLLHSLLLSLITAAVLTGIAVLLVYTSRLHPVRWIRGIIRFSTMGYAAPGAVIAVGVMVSFGMIDRGVKAGSGWLGLADSPFISGTIFAICFAYLVRFLTVAYQPVRAGMTRVCGNLDEASRTMGHSPAGTLFRINIPMIRGTLLAATMLVFVDILKELPLTMILRPTNFETLSTTAFGYAKEGRIHECSVPSLIIIAAGAIGLFILNRFMRHKEA